MQKLLYGLIGLLLLVSTATYVKADISIGIGLPNVSIGINLPTYPHLVPVPGYPVYYAPNLEANYFFYDGMYWVYQGESWYSSSWYNGPWWAVEPVYVPSFILRVPVGYYRQPPAHFHGWQHNAPPRWGQHWGPGWQQHRSGWDRWKRNSVPARAPLPTYQRQYSGDGYPHQVQQQHELRRQSYRYQPRDKAVRQQLQQQGAPRSGPQQQVGPPGSHQQQPRQGSENMRNPNQPQPQTQQRGPVHEQKQQREPEQHQQQAPRANGQEQRQYDRDDSQEPNRGHGQGQNKDDERGRGHNK